MALHSLSPQCSTNPDCVKGNTHSWLLNSNLVYLQWTVEVDGAYGPYQMCNLNITDKATGKPGDGKWYCDGARFDHTNFSDAGLCSTCAATKRAVGWCAMNESSSGYVSHRPSAICNTTFKQVCGSVLASNYSACRECGSRNYHQYLKNLTECNWSELCPRPPPASPTCRAAATQLCGSLRKSSLHHNCTNCLRNHSHALAFGACPNGEYESLAMYRPNDSGGWCPSPSSWYNSKSNATWVGPQQLHANHRLLAKTLGGSWFSTTASGRCPAGTRPSDGGGGEGCTWRPVTLKKAVNYSCVQANVAAPVLTHGRKCFAACVDGTERNPPNPSVRLRVTALHDCLHLCVHYDFPYAQLYNLRLGAGLLATLLLQFFHRKRNPRPEAYEPRAVAPSMVAKLRFG